ncbi:MAG: RNA-binding protein [Thermoproteales archaeon]|nr:RNA-binding protein [Thermoproteales archaeon]RLE66180.1 MAG: RNA-processing protein [Thermoprotei archaeon]
MNLVERNGKVSGSLTVPLNDDRIGVLIGGNGRVKKRIEKETKTKIEVDNENLEAVIKPDEGATLNDVYKAKRIIEAINYGFNPERALRLLEDDQFLDVIDLREYTKRREDMVRIKGRIIGEKGKFWRLLEEFTGAYVSVYGRYVAIIGDFDQLRIAKTALRMIIEGRQHGTVINYLKRETSDILRKMQLWRNM